MAWPLTSESGQSLGFENIDAQRMLLAVGERFRARDKVPSAAAAAGSTLGAAGAVALQGGGNPNSDSCGAVLITTGAGVAAGPLATITFSTVFAQAPQAVLLVPLNSVAAVNAGQAYIDITKILAASFTIAGAAAVAMAGAIYGWFVIP